MITEIGYLVAAKPEEAKRLLAKLITRFDGDVVRIAAKLSVSRKTADRCLTRVGLLKHAAAIRARVREERAK